MEGITGLMFLIQCYLFTVVRGGEICSTYHYNSFTHDKYHERTYCSTGCCGHNTDDVCCSTSAGAIIGIVTGCLIVVCIIAAVIIILVCHKTNKNTVGVVIVPPAPVYGQNPHTVYNPAWQSPGYAETTAPYYPPPQHYASPYPEKD